MIKQVNINNYSLRDLINSNIYINYTDNQSNNNKIEYLTKNKLFVPEYITEIYFNINDNKSCPVEPFGKIGVHDILKNKITYELYSTDKTFNSSWKAKSGYALVGFEYTYSNCIQKIRFLEAPIYNLHSLNDNVIFSSWYGDDIRESIDNKCFNCSVKELNSKLIYLENMFMCAFQLLYTNSINSFGKVYFKVGVPIIKQKLDSSQCCFYDDNSIENLCCKLININSLCN